MVPLALSNCFGGGDEHARTGYSSTWDGAVEQRPPAPGPVEIRPIREMAGLGAGDAEGSDGPSGAEKFRCSRSTHWRRRSPDGSANRPVIDARTRVEITSGRREMAGTEIERI